MTATGPGNRPVTRADIEHKLAEIRGIADDSTEVAQAPAAWMTRPINRPGRSVFGIFASIPCPSFPSRRQSRFQGVPPAPGSQQEDTGSQEQSYDRLAFRMDAA